MNGLPPDPGYGFVPLAPDVRRVAREQACWDRRIPGTLAGLLEIELAAEQRIHVGSGGKDLRDRAVVLRAAPIALLRAMWGTAHARRPHQKAALDDAGRWLEKRLGLQPDITPEQFALELGWLQRLMAIHSDGDDRDRRPGPRSTGQHGHGRDEPAFGAHLDRLRQRRESMLAAAAEAAAHRTAAQNDLELTEDRPTQLPGSFEACFTSWQEAMSAFRKARERRRDKRPAKDRLLPVQPVVVDLRPLAADIACSLLDTEGVNELEARAVADAGKLPPFWIAVADLVERDGKRVARRISFDPGTTC